MNSHSGVLLLALGGPSYGSLALNLAVSIKANDPLCQIALVHDEASLAGIKGVLGPGQRVAEWFDLLIRCPDPLTRFGGRRNYYLWPKLFLYELSPFEATLYLDVDTIIFPGQRVSGCLERLAGTDYTAAVSQAYPIDSPGGFWTRCEDVLRAYGRRAEQLLELHSFAQYFERSFVSRTLFHTAREIAANPGVDYRAYKDGMPDELALILAAFNIDLDLPIGNPMGMSWAGDTGDGDLIDVENRLGYTFTDKDPPAASLLYRKLVAVYAAERGLVLDATHFDRPKRHPFGPRIRVGDAAPVLEHPGAVSPDPITVGIPRTVHQIWINLHDSNRIPDRYLAFIDTWISRSGLEHRLYTHAELRSLIGDNFPEFADFYDRATFETEKSDIARYLLMHLVGGVYADADMECLRQLEPLLEVIRKPACLALEPPTHTLFGQRFLGSAFIASEPGIELWRELVDYMMHHYRANHHPVVTTGPAIVNRFLLLRGYRRDIHVLESGLVYARDVNDRDEVRDDPHSFCVHRWTGISGWVPRVDHRIHSLIYEQPHESHEALMEKLDRLARGSPPADAVPATPGAAVDVEASRSSRVFCALPWSHLHIGSRGAALPCEAAVDDGVDPGQVVDEPLGTRWNAHRFRALRIAMLGGRESRACANCYQMEAHGARSLRETMNRRFLEQQWPAIRSTSADGAVPTQHLVHLRLECGEVAGFGDPGAPRPAATALDATTPLFGEIVELPLQRLDFTGGEALVSPHHLGLLDRLISLGRTGITLFYSARLAHPGFDARAVAERWRRFDRVILSIPLEGLGARGEYLCPEQNPESTATGVQHLRQWFPEVEIRVECTVSLHNALHVPALFRYCQGLGLSPGGFPLVPLARPRQYSMTVLPEHHKRSVGEAFRALLDGLEASPRTAAFEASLERCLDYLWSSDDSHLLPLFKSTTLELDARRGQRFETVFPELADLITG